MKHTITFFVDQFITGGTEAVLINYIRYLTQNYKIRLVSSKKINNQYYLDILNGFNVEIIDDIDKNVTTEMRKQNYLKYKLAKFARSFRRKKLVAYTPIVDFKNFQFSNIYFKRGKHNEVGNTNIAFIHCGISFFDNFIGKSKLFKYHHHYRKIIFLTEEVAEHVKALCEDNEELAHKITCLYNPFNFNLIEKQALNDVLYQSHSNSSPYFVAVQRLCGDKDVKTIIDGFNIFKAQLNTAHKLLILGDGDLANELKHYAKDYSDVIFLGNVDNPYPFIKNAEALILSSTMKYGEGLPTVLIEAHILNTLAISSDVPSGPRDILMDGKAGILFKANCPLDLSNKLIYTQTAKEACNELINTARENLYRFDEKNIIDSFISIYESV